MRRQDRQRSNRAARSLVRRGPVFQSSARDRFPIGKTPMHDLSIVPGAQSMPTRTKVIRHRSVHRQETLRVAHRLEPPHAALALSRRLM